MVVQVPKLEEQLLLSVLPQDEADQRDIVLEVLNHQAPNLFIITEFLLHSRAFAVLPTCCHVHSLLLGRKKQSEDQ